MERRKQGAGLQTLLSMNRQHANQSISVLKQLKGLEKVVLALAQRQQASELAQLQQPGGGGGGVGRRSLQHNASGQDNPARPQEHAGDLHAQVFGRK